MARAVRRMAEEREFLVPLLVIGVLAFALRAYLVWSVQHIPMQHTDGDQWGYFVQAQRIAHRPQSHLAYVFPPGYTYFLGLLEFLRSRLHVPMNLRAFAGILQSLAAAGSVLAVGLLARRGMGIVARSFTTITASERAWTARVAGWLAALVLAVWPNSVVGATTLMSEQLFTPLLAIAMVLLFVPDEPPAGALWVVGGLLGLAIVTRAAGVPVGLLAVAYVASRPGSRRVAVRRSLRVAIPIVSIVGVWVGLLGVVTHQFVPIDAHGGFNLCIGNRDGATGTWDEALARQCVLPGDSIRADKELGRQARRWALQHPRREVTLVRLRMEAIWAADADSLPFAYADRSPTSRDWAQALATRWWHPMLWMSSLGAAILLAIRSRMRWFIGMGASLLLLPLLSTGDSRYHAPMVPWMAVCAGCAMVSVVLAAAEAVRLGTASSRRLEV